MDLTQLNRTCETVIKDAEETFFIHINNPLWDLTDNIIKVEIQTLKETVSQKVYGKMMHANNLSDAQFVYMRKVKNDYLRKSLYKCMDYAQAVKG